MTVKVYEEDLAARREAVRATLAAVTVTRYDRTRCVYAPSYTLPDGTYTFSRDTAERILTR